MFRAQVEGRVADSAMRKSLLNVQNLVKQFDSFEILCCDAARRHHSTGAATKIARQIMDTVLGGKPNAVSYAGSRFRFLSLARSLQKLNWNLEYARKSRSRYLDLHPTTKSRVRIRPSCLSHNLNVHSSNPCL